jgi:addiction module HigA family antidote
MSAQHPGKVLLQQYLEPQKLSQNKLARAIKVPPRRINEIIHQKRGITADTAVRLAIYFGGSANYWMHLQAEYEINKIKDNIRIQLSAVQAPPPTTMSSVEQTTNIKPVGKIKRRIMR